MPKASTGYEVVKANFDTTAPYDPTTINAPTDTFIVSCGAVDGDGHKITYGNGGDIDVDPTFDGNGNWTGVTFVTPNQILGGYGYIVCVGA